MPLRASFAKLCPGRQATRGFSLIGFLSSLCLMGLAGLLVLRAAPSIFEYWAIEKTIKASAAVSQTPTDLRETFDRLASAGYIDSLKGKDLVIKGMGDSMKVSFAYEKKIYLAGPASLLIVYRGSNQTDSEGKTSN
jgi:hypothetical protein